jgi:hypothetical protein
VPPGSHLGPIGDAERQKIVQSSDVFGHYEKAVDRESAYEKLKARTKQDLPAKAEPGTTTKPAGRQPQSIVEAAAKSAARSIGSELGRQIMRGILGSILGPGGRRRR